MERGVLGWFVPLVSEGEMSDGGDVVADIEGRL